MANKKLPPIHPGEILLLEYLQPLRISQSRLANEIGVPAHQINRLVHGKRSITASIALRLARYFGTSDRFWLNFQTHFDLEFERDRLGEKLKKEVRVLVR